MKRTDGDGRFLVATLIALLWSATARADEVAAPASAVTPAEETLDEETKRTLRRQREARNEGLQIGGVVSLCLGAGQLAVGAALVAGGGGGGDSGGGALPSFDFSGLTETIAGSVLLGSGGLGVVAGIAQLAVGASGVPVELKPGVAGQPGLTISGSF